MRSSRPLTLHLMLCACALAVSGCAARERLTPIFPPSADVRTLTAPKPVPPADIVTSAQAAARYDIEVETWGDTLSAAGGRVCRWLKSNGMTVECPER